jgi:hypothetical protein
MGFPSADDIKFVVGGTERLRIDNLHGNVNVYEDLYVLAGALSTEDPDSHNHLRMHCPVNDSYIDYSGGALYFRDNGTTKVTFLDGGDVDLEGDLYVGAGAKENWGGHFTVYKSTGDAIFKFANPSSTGYGGIIAGSTGTKYILKLSDYGDTEKFKFKGNGDASFVGDLTDGTSDIRLKDNRVLIPSALDKVNSISGYSFDWNDKQPMHEAGTHDVGLLAQEVQPVLPEAVCPAPFDFYGEDPDTPEHLVGTSKSGEDYLTIQYDKVVPLLVNAIKELSAKVEALEAELES